MEIFPLPVVSLTVDNNTPCSGETVTITAVSNEPIQNINWNGAAPNGQNPITVPINNTTTITAEITSSSFCSNTASVTLQPQAATASPVINCGNSTATSVEFLWSAVAGATGYEVSINGNTPEVVTATSYLATGFSSNTQVSISVTPLGVNCPGAATSAICSTLTCPDAELSITVLPICLSASTVDINLSYTSTVNTGTFTWSGVGIVDPVNGTFSPTLAGVGSHTITLTRSEGACVYTDTAEIVVHGTPTSTFTFSEA
ncbi:MAG: hypothetical protein R2795_01805 [Saprospiraceae bacterium]